MQIFEAHATLPDGHPEKASQFKIARDLIRVELNEKGIEIHDVKTRVLTEVFLIVKDRIHRETETWLPNHPLWPYVTVNLEHALHHLEMGKYGRAIQCLYFIADGLNRRKRKDIYAEVKEFEQ